MIYFILMHVVNKQFIQKSSMFTLYHFIPALKKGDVTKNILTSSAKPPPPINVATTFSVLKSICDWPLILPKVWAFRNLEKNNSHTS